MVVSREGWRMGALSMLAPPCANHLAHGLA
jgi:hypothetical protein